MALQSMGDKRKTQPDRVEVNLSKKVKSSEVRRPIIAPTSQFPPPPSPGHFPISAFPFSISPLSFALFVQIVCTPMSHRRMTNLTSAHSNPPPTTMDQRRRLFLWRMRNLSTESSCATTPKREESSNPMVDTIMACYNFNENSCVS